MTGTKIRHQFLLDASTSERLNALARGPGATKTDIIAEAIKAFLERGSDGEFAQISSMRLDKISYDIEAVRQELGAVRHEVETVREGLAAFVRFSLVLNANVPSPDKNLQATGHERFLRFVARVVRQTASGASSFASREEGDSA